jgi:hypothetical protein
VPDTSIHELTTEHAELRATLAFLREQVAEAEDSRWARGRAGEAGYLGSLREQESECRRRLADIAQALKATRAATLDGIVAKAAVLGSGAAERQVRLRRAAERAMPDFGHLRG